MSPKEAAAELVRKLGRSAKGLRPMTVADASVASGLPLRDAEAGLHWLTSEHRGHLRVTEDGDLVHVFPHGFEKPWETREALARLAARVGAGLLAAGRFVVRVWLLAVMVGYAALFVALLVGLTLARQGDDRDDGRSGLGLLGGLLRMIGDALFWTLHPFSPIYVGAYDGWSAAPVRAGWRRDQPAAPRLPFYEKVNRFVFGPGTKPLDPRATEARVLAEIRAQKGRIGLADVMRVTGLPRDEADPMMARLMLDYEGEVDVGEQGGIVYRFAALRRTASDERAPARPPPAWAEEKRLPPLTGNDGLANVLVALLNGFNLLASGWVMASGLTIGNILLLFSKHRPPVLPDAGLPIALGLVPFVFSLALFALPLARAALRVPAERRAKRENARLAVLREVLARAPKKEPVSDERLRTVWRVATGAEPSSREITARVVELGGDVDPGPNGEIRYRFADLEEEAEALEDERAEAPEAERRLGKVVFASDD